MIERTESVALTSNERLRFEVWAQKEGFAVPGYDLNNGRYFDEAFHWMWFAWKSRAETHAHETLPPRITVMDDGRAMGGSDVCHTCEAHCTVINDLQTALRGLYWDNVDYLTLNKLGGMQNHWMRAARMALGMDVDDVRHSEKALEPRTESILDRKVTVCASCLCANCWQGDFYCDNYKTASTVDKTVRELFQINANGVREDSGYWFKDVDTGKVDYYAKSAAKRAFNALSEPV